MGIKKRRKEAIAFLEERLPDLDVRYALEGAEFDCAEDVREILEDNGLFDIEIIYYTRAMDFLREHDSSLKESLGVAAEYGYSLENLNSELLATLLTSKYAREDFYELEDELEEILQG